MNANPESVEHQFQIVGAGVNGEQPPCQHWAGLWPQLRNLLEDLYMFQQYAEQQRIPPSPVRLQH